MPNKSFSNYGATTDTLDAGNQQLVIEIAKSHIGCMAVKEAKKSIAAYELFTFTEEESADFEQLFGVISAQSELLTKQFSVVTVYNNHEFCLPVPIFKFNKEIAAEYAQLVFGTELISKLQFEHLPIEPGIINVYRVNEDCFNCLNRNYTKVSFHHTYSNIICRLNKIADRFHAGFIYIQFYNTFMIVVVMKEGNLQLIQTFDYQAPEDVLYYLLNITQNFQLSGDTLTIQISGMIDLDFKLYRELITYFKNVVVEHVNQSALSLKITEHPQHYFTPLFNLA